LLTALDCPHDIGHVAAGYPSSFRRAARAPIEVAVVEDRP
jgi:hypothetical protein